MNNDVELIPVKGVLPTVQTQSDNVIYVPQAHKNKPGIVKEGDGINIENGVVSLNKQTVEDMIDANKWVSYGFEQNLTEDEKGMARHNIGAGDNDFTGSWLDLANRPQETVDFAESERQKSLNLCWGFEWGDIVTQGKVEQDSNTVIRNINYLPVKPNAEYTFGFGSNIDIASLKYYSSPTLSSSVGVSGNTSTKKVITTPSDCNYIRVVAKLIDTTQDINNQEIYLYEGDVNYGYTKPYGAIVHEKDAPVSFAESERQKSKNLFGVNLVNKSFYPADGTSYSSATRVANDLPITLDSGNYAISNTDKKIVIYIFDIYNNYIKDESKTSWSSDSKQTFTITATRNVYFVFKNSDDSNISPTDVQNIMLNSGAVAEPYVKYNGPITHNGDASVVFAESERQKSKNLFDLKRLVFGSFSNASINYNNETITLNQRANSTADNLLSSFADLEAGKTYTLSFKTTGNVKYFYINNTGFYWTSGTSHAITQEELDSGIHIYGMDDATVTISNIQIEVGTVATDYQSYNGEIVHEKDIQPNIITAKLTSEFYPEQLETVETIPLSYAYGVGDKLTMSGNSIVVGEGVSKVKISACVIYKGSTSTFNCYIYHNTTQINLQYHKPHSSDGGALVFTDFIIPVSQGDTIALKGYTYDTSMRVVGSTTYRTYLTVEVVE